MYSKCATQRSAERQRMMELVLLDEMLQKPYPEITISSLCIRMHIQRRTFYRYFDNKDSALVALIDHSLLECIHKRKFDGIASVEENIEKFFSYWKENRSLLDVLSANDMMPLFLHRVIEVCRKEIGAFPHDMFYLNEDQDYLRFFLTGGVMHMIIQWHHNDFRESVEHMAALTSRLIKNPIPQ